MTFAEALAYAREHQPRWLAAQSRMAASDAAAKVPRGLWFPRLTAMAEALAATENNSTAAYANVPGIDLVRIGSTRVVDDPSMRPYASTLVAAGVRQEIFDFGRIAAQTAAADALASAEHARGDSERLQIELGVEEGFRAVTAAKLVCQAAEDAYQRAKVSRDMAKAGVDSGMRKPIELTRAEADVSRFEVGLIRAQGAVVAAQSVLAATVGVPGDRLDASGDVPARPEPGPAAAMVRLALEHAPELQVARSLEAAQRAQTRTLAAERRPDLSLTSSIGLRAGGAPPSSGPRAPAEGLLPNVPNWDVGLVLAWPIVDAPSAAREDASSMLEQARSAERRALASQLAASVQQAWVATQVAQQTLPSLARSLQAAKANYTQADTRFKAGLGNLLELADAQALRTEAEIQVALGEFEYARARARLGLLVGEQL